MAIALPDEGAEAVFESIIAARNFARGPEPGSAGDDQRGTAAPLAAIRLA
jgi:hypothetical protein